MSTDSAELTARLLALSPERRQVLERLLRTQGLDRGPDDMTIPRRPTDGPAALSFAQRRLWFLDQLVPGSSLYNVPAALRLTTPVDPGVLGAALSEVVRRHEALRTTFVVDGGGPLQVVGPAAPVAVEVVDLTALGPGAEGEAARLAAEEAARPFDLGTGPLLRARLVVLGPRDQLLLLTLHHIVADGWSLGLLFGELTTLYGAFVAGRPSPLEELAVQYGDFATWQAGWLSGERLEAQLAYWRDQLGDLPVLALPTDRPRPALERYSGAARAVRLAPGLGAELKSLAAGGGATLYMALLAGFAVVLGRWADSDDVVVGTPIAGRTRAEIESLIGFFVNTLVLRVDLSGDPSFVELLARVRTTALGAYAHQDLPFEMLVEHLAPARDLSRNPLFQVMFQLRAATGDPATAGPSVLDVDRGTAAFDLAFSLAEGPPLQGVLEYNTDLFDAATAERLVAQFSTFLAAAVAAPHTPVSGLDALPEAERRRLLVDWNATAAPLPATTLHALVEAQVDATPDAPAVVGDGGTLTYAELDAASNALAHHLRALGVGRDQLVGVCLPRSPALVVALLGVLKAGAAYLPLDPDYPRARLAFMLDDAEVAVLVSTAELLEGLPSPAHTVALDACADLARRPRTRPGAGAAPGDLAYAIYTSGSTGQPKGVLIEHRGVVNVAQEQIRMFGTGPHSRVLQFSSLSFDASTFEIAMALAAGGAVVVGDRDALAPGPPLAGFLRRHRVSTVTLPPSALAVMPVTELPDLAIITVAGEACPAAVVERWASPGRRFFNLYGPTEASIWATAYECPPAADGPPPIGRPIANTTAYVLDRHRRPAPIGVPGELYLGGVGLARGYLNRPELTAERFVAHPFDPTPGARLYRTGDLVRWRADGRLEFLGRLDHQVKIRGFRIELGEIETALGAHPGVRGCVVVAGEDRPGDRSLVAYVAGDDHDRLRPDQLRRHLEETLPAHMVPGTFVVLDALPLSANGKVDRAALPAPQRIATGHVAPQGAAEERIAELYAEVLGTGPVGAGDDFFADLGGHSLLATQLLSRLRDAFELDLPLRALFEAPTVSQLAEVVEAAGGVDEDYEEGEL